MANSVFHTVGITVVSAGAYLMTTPISVMSVDMHIVTLLNYYVVGRVRGEGQ